MPAADLLGRDTELAVLTSLLEEARAGEQRVALVCGDPGIGKTTLVEALEGVAAEAGFATVWGRCWEGGGGGPFWPWAQVLRACLRDHGDSRLTVTGPGRAELGRLLPELRPAAEPAAVDSDDARMSLFTAVADVLETATGKGLVVALDDLHDADEGSLQLLRFLARRAFRVPLLLVGTYRVREVARSPAHQRALSAVGRHGPTIRLRRLSPADVAVLVERIGSPVAMARLPEVYEATDGNPFLVYEASRLLGSTGAGATAVDLLEQAGSTLVNARLDPLPPQVRGILSGAAVLGRDFSLPVLRQLCDLQADDLVDLLGQASDLHVLEETALGRWSFSHSLLREELLRQLDPGERRRLHRRAAAALETQSEDEAGAGLTAIAHHLVEGRDPRALESTVRAARSAMEALAFEDAAVWYELALTLVPDGSPADIGRYELLLELGEARLRAGDVPRATDAFGRAVRAGQALGSVELAAEAAVRIAPYTSTDATVIGALDDALCDLPETDSSLRARVLVGFAQVLKTSSVDRTVLQDVSRQGLEMARRLGDEETLWTVLTQWHQNVAGILTAEQRAERLRASEELVRLAEAAGTPHRVVQARLARAQDLLRTAQPDAALVEAEECLRMARELRQPLTERQALLLLFDLRWFVGDLGAAEEVIGRLADSRIAVDEDRSELEVTRTTVTLRRLQGRFGEVERLARASLDRWAAYGLQCVTQIALVNALAEQGRTDDARALLDQFVGDGLVEESFGMTIEGYGWIPAPRLCCPCALVQACCLLGNRKGAEALYERLLPHGEDFSLEQGVCARYLGLAAALLGRHDEADRHFQAAHVVSERLGARLWGAQGRLDHGRTLLERGDPDDRERAEALLLAARDGFAAMGIDVFTRRATELLDRARPSALGLVNRARLVQDGEYWTFSYGDEVARLRDSKGLRYLAQLLRNPGQEVHAVDLSGATDAEQARQNVSRAVKTAVERLGAVHPLVGEHLRSTVRTGLFSVYVPDPRAPIAWDT